MLLIHLIIHRDPSKWASAPHPNSEFRHSKRMKASFVNGRPYSRHCPATYHWCCTSVKQMFEFISRFQVSNGVVDAPVGRVSILFMHMDGHKMLSAWNPTVMATVTSIFENCVSSLLFRFNGYLVSADQDFVLCDLSLCHFCSRRMTWSA